MKRSSLVSKIVLATLFGLNTGCTLKAKSTVDALLESPSAKTREVLEQHIGDYFNGQSVKLADNVFSTSSTVIIERTGLIHSRKNNINQRGIPAVDTFTLVLINDNCMLRHNQSSHLLELQSISCKARN